MVASAAADAATGAPPRGLSRLVIALTSVLGANYRDAWPTVLPVVAHLFTKLGRAGAGLVDPLLLAIASICRCAPHNVELLDRCDLENGVAFRAVCHGCHQAGIWVRGVQ